MENDGSTIPDYGKVLYAQQRAAKAERRRARKRDVPTKEIRLLVGIANRDFDIKVQQARRLLEGHSDLHVCVCDVEPPQEPLAETLLSRFLAALEDVALGVTPQPWGNRRLSAVVWSL